MPKCLKTLGSPSDLLQLERAEVMTGVRPQIDFEGKASRLRLGTMVEYEGRRGTKEDSKDSGLKHWKDGAAMKHDRGKCGRGKVERWIRSSNFGHPNRATSLPPSLRPSLPSFLPSFLPCQVVTCKYDLF